VSRTHETWWVGEAPSRADLLAWVLEETGVCPDVASPGTTSRRHVVSLAGGVDALTYLVRCPGRDVVVKLSDYGLEAEARALRAWAPHTSGVPQVLTVGTVPSTRVRFLVLTALKNDHGDVVETAVDYLNRSPSSAHAVGRALGDELHEMHQARCCTGFGNFADSPGAERTYGTWSSYLEDFFRQHADYVRRMGVSDRRIEQSCTVMRRSRYVDEGRYLHGDVSIRNIAIRGYDPVRISLFDPNPLSGDPSWDVAPMANNVEFNERRRRADAGSSEVLTLDRELLAGFWESYPRELPEESLLTAQLVQAVLQAEHRERASDRGDIDDLDVDVAHEFIRDLMNRISA
jgi:fructosamine-3-kinase